MNKNINTNAKENIKEKQSLKAKRALTLAVLLSLGATGWTQAASIVLKGDSGLAGGVTVNSDTGGTVTFKGGDTNGSNTKNISVAAGADNTLTFTLKPTLTGIQSIQFSSSSGTGLTYNSTWANAVGGNTGLSFNGKPITPYYGVNSGVNGGNYYGQGATGSDAIAIGIGASSTNLGTIAIGQNASATNKHSIAIGLNAQVVGDGTEHGIAIGGGSGTKAGASLDEQSDAAMAGRNVVAIGYNVRMGEAGHSFGMGTNMIVKGGQNFVLSAADGASKPTKVYGQSNTVIGANNLLDGKYIYQRLGTYEKRYGDIARNLVFGDGNTITGTEGVNATSDTYNGDSGAYKNIILGSKNTLNGNNYRNNLLASNAVLNKGAHHNTLLGSNITVNSNVNSSYVLGSNVTVTANNSVYFGDSSTAYTNGILRTPNGSSPTTITASTTAADIEKYGLTIGEEGQTTAVIGGRGYTFAGLGQVNGGVISVGKVELIQAANGVPAHYESVGRIIQNVAPGLIGASSTDAVNGSQLYAVTRAIDLSIARVTSGESGPVVYTTESGERLYKEGSIFYKTTVTTVTDTSTNTTTTYQQATNGFWYPTTSFTNGILNAGVGISEGKTLAQLAMLPQDRTSEVEVKPSNLVLSAVNAEQDSSSNPAEQAAATTTLTTLKNIKNALTVLATEDLNNAAIALYKDQTPGATETTWNDLSPDVKKTWLEKATINNAKAKLTELLKKTNTSDADVQRALSQAVTLQDLQTLAQAGLDFAGDSGTAVHRKLSETLTIQGGETAAANLTTLADKNIGVVADGTGSLNVLLAKNLTSLTSVQTVNNNAWQKQPGDNATLTSTSSVTKLDAYGLHLGQAGTTNTEKASVMLLNPENSLKANPKDNLINNISPILATASNGAWGTGGSSISGGAQNNGANNGYIFGNTALGLLVGSLAEGSKTDFTGATGQGYAVFLGLRNGVVDATKTPESKGQPIIYDLSHAENDNKKMLPGKASTTTESSGPIAIGAYNSITGNSGLAVGSLNRVYGNGGVVVGTTSVADAYSSVGRFGVTMGFNVKNGEWSQQSVAIGANLQAVGSGNIILGGGTDKYYGASHWQGADGQVETTTNGVYTTLGNVFNNGTISNAGMRFFGDRNIVLGAKNRTEGFNPNVGGAGYGGNAGNGSYTRIADNAITGANNSIRDLSFRNSVYGSNNVVTAGADNMIIGSGNKIQAAYKNNLSYTYTDATGAEQTGYVSGSATSNGNPILVEGAQALGNLWRVRTSGANDTLKANTDDLLYGSSNAVIGARNTIGYNTTSNFVAGSDNVVGAGSGNNMILGNQTTISEGITGSYVLGSHVTVNQKNSVYIGDASVATINPTSIYDVQDGMTKTTGLTYGTVEDFSALSAKALNELITAGEKGQQSITINDKYYKFAGLGKKDGGVISVGGIRVVDGKNVSYGRIIQNVAPGLVGANSTDAVNGSQLYAIYNAIDATIKQVVIGEQGPVVYTDQAGNRLLNENNKLYNPAVATGYKRAVDGLWYRDADFNQDGSLNDPNNIFGKTLNDLNTNGAYYQASDGKWYTQDQLESTKTGGNFVVKADQVDKGISHVGVTDNVVDAEDAILSLVNAEKQANPATQKDATKERTILANLKEALPILNESDLKEQAIALYNATGATTDWTLLSDEAQKPYLAQAASNQAKTAITDLLAKKDWLTVDAQTVANHELSKAATLQDIKTVVLAGLDFAGDSGDLVHRNLSETLKLTGGVTDTAKLTDNNIGVVANGTDTLTIKLAKDVKGLNSTNYGTVTTTEEATSPFTGFTKYMASAVNPKSSVNNVDLYIGSNRSEYTATLDNTGLHLGSGTTEKATISLINPKNSLNSASAADGLSVIFSSANNGGYYLLPSDENVPEQVTAVKNAYDGKIFGKDPLGLLVGTMAEGSSSTMKGTTGTGFGVFVGFNNGVVPITKADGTAFTQPTIFKDVVSTRSEAGDVQGSGGSSAVVFGAFNSISGNGGLALGTLNRVYGNEGIVVGNTTIANSYSSVGRFGVTMGFNLKAGEWAQQSVVIGSNLQSVGQGNIILGGGENKFYGAGSGWADTIDANGVYTKLANTFDGSADNLTHSGMRFWGDRNIVIGAKNRTEGFNTSFNTQDTSSGYTGSTGNGAYTRIADNAVVGTNNTLYDLSKMNTVYGSNNAIASGTNNMVIGSDNRIQAQLTKIGVNDGAPVVITGNTTNRSAAETAAIAALGSVTFDTTGKPTGLTYGDNNTILGSRNTVGYNAEHNFLAGGDNVVAANTMFNFLAGSGNVSGVDLENATDVEVAVKNITKGIPLQGNMTVVTSATANSITTNLGIIQKFPLGSLLQGKTGMNLLAGSFNIAGTGTSNNVVEGSNVILRNNVKSTYVLGSHIDADQSNSVYIGDYSVATTTPLSTTKGAYTGDLNSLDKNGTDSTIGLNDLMTAGSAGQTSIVINGKTYNFAGVGRKLNENALRSTVNEVGTITVGRMVNEGTADEPNYVSYGRVIQNVAPGLVGENSTDAINGSQLYAIWDAMESSVARVVTGLDGTVVYTSDEGHRLYSWNNTLYDSALVDGKFKQAANGQWYPVAAFDGGSNQLKTAFSGSSGFTLGEINTAKMEGRTLTVTGRDSAEVSSTPWLQSGTADADTTSQVVGANRAVLSLVNGRQSTTGNIALYNVANALTVPAQGTTTQSQQQVAVSKLLKGQTASGEDLSAYDFSQATNLKDLQNLALAGLDFTGDTLPKDAESGDKVTVHRNLSEALKVTGGVTDVSNLSTGNNIGVIASNKGGSLTLRLAKDLTGLTSTEYTTTSTTNGTTTTTINSSGVTIQGPTPSDGTAPAPISITTDGIDAGNTNITNVKSGLTSGTTVDNTNSSYGATLGDVQKLVNAAAWDIGQTTTKPASGSEGTSTTTSEYTSKGTVNTAERVSFDAGKGIEVSVKKTAATEGASATPETYNIAFNVKTAELKRDSSTGTVSLKEGGDEGGYATAENVKDIFNQLNTNVSAAKFGLADSTGTGKVEKLLNNTIQITGFDDNISTVAAKSTDQAAANDVLKIKLSPTVTLGDTETAGKLTVKNAGQADQVKAVTLSDGAITFTTLSDGTKADYTLGVKADGTKLPDAGESVTNSPRLTFNGKQLATLVDGISYQGDIKFAEGGANPFTTALGGQLNILGGVPTSITANDLTTGNIAVVSNGTNTLNLQLRKDLSNMNSIAFGGTAAPYVKMELGSKKTTNMGTAEQPNNVTTSELHFSGLTSNIDTTRITGIFSDKITKTDGIQFTTKGDSDVVTVKELKEVATANTNTITTTVKNLYYGFTTGSEASTKNRAVNIINTSEDGTLPKPDDFLKILGDSNITVDLTGTPVTGTNKSSTDGTALQFTLNKDVVLGTKGENTGGSVTVQGDEDGAFIKLDGTSHTLTINSPKEGEKPSSTFTLDGRQGKLVFGGNQNTATIIDFSNAENENSLSVDADGNPIAIKRITVGTAANNAPVATMQDGLKFTGNNNDTVARFLNSTLEIKGGATVTGTGANSAVTGGDISKATTDKNTYVAVEEYDTNKKDGQGQPIMDKRMVIRLAKDMTDLNTITLGGQDLGGGSTASTVKLSTTADVTVGSGEQQKTYSALRLDSANPVLLRNLAEGIEGSDAATVSQLKNAAWTIGTVSGTNPSTSVNGGDTVNFANGTGTTADVAVSTTSGVDTYTVKFNIDTGSITSNSTTGAAETTDGENKFVDSKTIVSAINNAMSNTNQKYTADNKTGDGAGATKVTVTRKSGDTLGLIGGATGTLTDNNIGTEADKINGTIAIKLAKNLTGLESTSYTTTEGGNTYTTTINSKGLSIVPARVTEADKATKTITLTENGLYNGNKNITGLTSPLTVLSTTDGTHVAYGGLSPEFLSTLRDLGVKKDGSNKSEEKIKEEQAQLASAATVGDLQNLSNMPIYFSADNYQDTLKTTVAKKLGEQLSIETGQFNMTLKAGTTDTYDISTYDANSADAYNDENMAAVVKDGGIRFGFRNKPIFKGVRIGTITTQDGTTTEHSISIANTTNYTQTDAIPTLKIGDDKAVQITNIATPTEKSTGDVAVNKAYVDAAKSSLTGTGAAVVTSTSDANGTHYNVHVDKWLTYTDATDNALTDVRKGADGKYYNAADIAGLQYDTTAKKWTKENGDEVASQPKAITSAIAKLYSFEGTVNPVLSNVGKGKIDEGSAEAINGSQLKQLVNKLGLSVNDDKTEITGTFSSVDASGSNEAPTNVVNAINQLTTAVNKGRVYAGDDYVAASGTGTTEKNALKRELGERINFIGGASTTTTEVSDGTATGKKKVYANLTDANIAVVRNMDAKGTLSDDTFAIKLAKDLKGLSSTTYTDTNGNKTVINGGGVTIQHPTPTGGQNVISITKDGIDAGDTTISHVKMDATSSGDVATNKDYVDSLAKAATSKVTGTGAAIVTAIVNPENKSTTYNVYVGQTMAYVDKDGKELTKVGDNKFYKASAIANLHYDANQGKWLNSDGAVATTQPTAVADNQLGGVALVDNSGNTTGGKVVLSNVKDNLKPDATEDEINARALALYNAANGTNYQDISAISQADQVPYLNQAKAEFTPTAATNTLLTQTAGLTNATTLKDLQTVAKAGLNFAGNDNVNVNRPLSTQLTIKGDGVTADDLISVQDSNGQNIAKFQNAAGNIAVVNDSGAEGGLLVQLNKNLININSIASGTGTNSAKITLRDGGLDRKDENGNIIKGEAPQVSVNSAKITDVADGVNDSDAVNVKQLNELKTKAEAAVAAATTKVTGTGAAVVTATTNDDKSVTYNVHVDQTMAYVDKEGHKLIKGSDDKFYQEGALDGLHYVAGKDGKDGRWVDKDGKDATTPPTAVDSEDFGGIALVDENGNVKTGDDSKGVTISNVTNTLAGKATGNGSTSTEKDKNNNDKGSNEFLKTLQGDTLTATEKASAATVGDLKKLADSPLFFSGDNTNTASIAKKLGSELSITSGAFTVNGAGNFTATTRNNVVAGSYSNRNIAVMNTGTGLVVGMLDTPTFNNVSVKDADGATVTLEKVTGKPGKDGEAAPPAVQFGSKDTNGNTVPVQIKNVASPVDGTDVVNKNYVDNMLDKTINPSIKAATTEVTGSGAAVVTKSEDGNDHHTIYNVHVDQTTALVDKEGNRLTTLDGGKTYYKASDIVNGKPKDDAKKIAAKDVTDVSMVKPDGTTDGGMVIRNVASAVGKDDKGNPKSIKDISDEKILNSAANVGDIKNALKEVNDNITYINKTVTNQITENKENITNNRKDITSIQGQITGGFQVGGDMNTEGSKEDAKRRFKRSLGDTFDIVGGVTETNALTDDNIGVVADTANNRLNVKLAKKLTGLTSVSSQEFVSETTDDNGITTKTTIAGGTITINKPGENGLTTTTTIEGGNVIVAANVNNNEVSKVQLTAVGLDNGGNRITNVAPGILPTDAATVGQLNGVQTLVKKVEKDSVVGDSLNAALAALKPLQYDPLEPTQIMAGTGYYRGQTAVALGVAHYQNESLMYNIGAAYGNSSHMMFNAGVTWKFGNSKREQKVADEYRQGPISSSYVMEDQMKSLQAENQKLREDMAKQDERLKKQEELLQQALRQLQQLTQQQQDSQKPN